MSVMAMEKLLGCWMMESRLECPMVSIRVTAWEGPLAPSMVCEREKLMDILLD